MKSKVSSPLPDVRAAILRQARELVGTPFRHQGRVPGRGLDCLGVIVCVGRALKLFSHDRRDYPRVAPDGETLFREVARAGFTPIDPALAGPGDVYVMAMTRDPQHVALVTDRGILHAWLAARAVVEHGLDEFWASRIVAAFRFPGVN